MVSTYYLLPITYYLLLYELDKLDKLLSSRGFSASTYNSAL